MRFWYSLAFKKNAKRFSFPGGKPGYQPGRVVQLYHQWFKIELARIA